MGKLASALEILKQRGLPGVLGAIRRNIYSQLTTWCFARVWDSTRDSAAAEAGNLRVRRATLQDLEAIMRVWPPEFSHIGGDLLRRQLRHRFEKGIACFVVCESQEVVSAVWCPTWPYEAVLPTELRGRGAYELTNAFTVPRLRGHGLAVLRLRYTMDQMAREGRVLACARILAQRLAAIGVVKKMGFENLGLLTTGTRLGRSYCRLEQAAAPH